MTPPGAPPAIALIGGGPRAVSVIERIAARLAAASRGSALEGFRGVIHVIDDVQPGAGRVWRADQPRELCMNTLADAVSLFVDPSVRIDGPAEAGPTLHEWSRLVAGRVGPQEPAIDPRFADMIAAAPPRPGMVEAFAEELAVQRPESHPSRALFGEYIAWCYGWARRSLPEGIVIEEHRARAIDLEDVGSGQVVHLSDGRRLAARAVALLPGWLPPAERPSDVALAQAVDASSSLVWIRPDSPADQPLDRVPDGASAIVRGLGMGFFDTMALLTLGRGGCFVGREDGSGRDDYVPSGREPVLHVTSHRGLPFRAKSLYGGLPPAAPRRRLHSTGWAAGAHPIDFGAEVWPLILKDAIEAYCRASPEGLCVGVDDAIALLDAAPQDEAEILAVLPSVIAGAQAREELRAALDIGVSRASHDDIRGFVAADLDHARAGAGSALKAALWTVSAARAVTARVGAFGRFEPSSQPAYRRLHSIGGMAGSGPPAFRSRQLLALADAGIVRFLGGGIAVDVEGGRFVARAEGEVVHTADVLIDAFMRFHDAEDSGDPLIRRLLEKGRLRPFRIGEDRSGVTGGVDVEPGTWRTVDAEGRADSSLFMAGIPLEQTIGDTIISPLPGSDSTMLRECDAVARGLIVAWLPRSCPSYGPAPAASTEADE